MLLLWKFTSLITSSGANVLRARKSLGNHVKNSVNSQLLESIKFSSAGKRTMHLKKVVLNFGNNFAKVHRFSKLFHC